MRFFDLRRLERAGFAISRLPVCLRVVLESLLRNKDGARIRDEEIEALARWEPHGARTREVPFVVSRVLLQDFTGVPLLVDLAAMRDAAVRAGARARDVEPRVPVALVVDHSVQVDWSGRPDAFALNHGIELKRNAERYSFLKWGQSAFSGLRLVPPGIGICHQVNLEHLAEGVVERDGLRHFDTLVGTDSHTTMVNGLGVLGWGVGGIEAEAAMLGEPVSFLEPDVVGVRLEGRLPEGSTATDLVLLVTERLRKARVVGKLVEFHGPGTASLLAAERATIANMAPEYGATAGFFPVDEETLRFYRATGRSAEHVARIREYHELQGVFGIPEGVEYSEVVTIDLAAVEPSVAGPRRPQDRIPLRSLKEAWHRLLEAPPPAGYGIPAGERDAVFKTTVGLSPDGSPARGGEQEPSLQGRACGTNPLTELEMVNNRPTPDPAPLAPAPARAVELRHGSIAIAAITSCTNTSNPGVMLAAGLLARNAVALGLRVPAHVKTSLAPGSRAVTEYLRSTGLLEPLETLGFDLVGYGCTTCIGNSGPLDARISAVASRGVVLASVLSGNRNFEARIHQSVRANFLASPPLVVAYALAGRIDVDLDREPLGVVDGRPVFLRDVWPSPDAVSELLAKASDPALYARLYADVERGGQGWSAIAAPPGELYAWDERSTYIRRPPYFDAPRSALEDIRSARALAILGDSITTDHISPAGVIRRGSPAGDHLASLGVPEADWNTYGARRGNHEVMVRGTFANPRIRNLMVPGEEGGWTIHVPSGERLSIYDASVRYAKEGVPLVIFAGQDYGQGSSRDWAAKGTRLLGVRAVIARSFERIHRANLIGMGVLPLQLDEETTAASLGLTGRETFSVLGLGRGDLRPRDEVDLVVHAADGRERRARLLVRIDTPIELVTLRRGGLLPHLLEGIVAKARRQAA